MSVLTLESEYHIVKGYFVSSNWFQAAGRKTVRKTCNAVVSPLGDYRESTQLDFNSQHSP